MEQRDVHFEALCNEWFRQFHRPIHGYFYALTHSVHLAEDLTQETFVRVWENREKYEERGNIKAFLFRIASHCLNDWFRKKYEILCDEKIWSVLDRVSDSPQPEEEAVLSEESRRLQETMRLLTSIQQQVLTMHYFGDLKFAEIATVLELPLNTVLSHARRGVAVLKEHMKINEYTTGEINHE